MFTGGRSLRNVKTRTCSLSLPSPKDLGFIYDRSIFFSIIASISPLLALINHSKIPENIDRFMYATFFIVGFDQSVVCFLVHICESMHCEPAQIG